MEIKTLVLGDLQTNCYLLIKGNNAIVIDPADDAQKIINELSGYNVNQILVTHHHFDHIGALDELEEYYGINHNNFSTSVFNYEEIKNPGHTDDSISFYFKDENILFGGDFIFYGSIGRFDFENSSEAQMKESLEMISKLPDETIIYPGHGPKTILGNEKKYFSYYFK